MFAHQGEAKPRRTQEAKLQTDREGTRFAGTGRTKGLHEPVAELLPKLATIPSTLSNNDSLIRKNGGNVICRQPSCDGLRPDHVNSLRFCGYRTR